MSSMKKSSGAAVRAAFAQPQELHRSAGGHAARADRRTSIAPTSRPAPTSSRPTRSTARPVSLAEFGLEDHVFEINKTAAELARRAADEFTRRNPDKPRFVAGSIGPTNKQLSMGIHVEDPGRRDVTFDQMVANYTEQIAGLVAGGVDILLPETAFDTLVMKACLFAIDAVLRGDRHAAAGDDLGHDLRRTAARCRPSRSRRSITRSRTSTRSASGSTAPSAST